LFINSDLGIQISGIKKEDFVNRNIAPTFNFGIGKYLNNNLSMQIGYNGIFFKTIANNDKRQYNYYNIIFENVILKSRKEEKTNLKKSISFQIGGGLFHNLYSSKLNFCGQVGLIGMQPISNKTIVTIRVISVMGWDLYQGDEDIINSFVVGVRQIL
jgi:hypothetical protein